MVVGVEQLPEVTVTELLVVEVHVAPEPTAMAPAASSVASGTSTLRLVVAVMGVPPGEEALLC